MSATSLTAMAALASGPKSRNSRLFRPKTVGQAEVNFGTPFSVGNPNQRKNFCLRCLRAGYAVAGPRLWLRGRNGECGFRTADIFESVVGTHRNCMFSGCQGWQDEAVFLDKRIADSASRCDKRSEEHTSELQSPSVI